MMMGWGRGSPSAGKGGDRGGPKWRVVGVPFSDSQLLCNIEKETV